MYKRQALARVELDTQQAHGVETKTYGAFGEAGLNIQAKTLAPFFTLVLSVTFTEVAIEIDVGGGEASRAVFDESGLSEGAARLAAMARLSRCAGGKA